jgi:hypothetical protein
MMGAPAASAQLQVFAPAVTSWHMDPGAQSAMVVQATLHRSVIASQLKGAQLVIMAPSTHMPLLHCRLTMAACFVEHLGAPHAVPSG